MFSFPRSPDRGNRRNEMSDSAFKTAPYPAYTTDELKKFLAKAQGDCDVIRAEIERRAKVKAGDTSVMTDGERLRHVRKTT